VFGGDTGGGGRPAALRPVDVFAPSQPNGSAR
jgi:hypothetical protein